MFRIDGISGESIGVDGNWVEKLRTKTPREAAGRRKAFGDDIKEMTGEEEIRR